MLLKSCKRELKTYFRRYCTNENADPSKPQHIFTKTPFQNYFDLVEHLRNSVIFNKDGLVVINRPYGLKKQDPPSPEFSQEMKPKIYPTALPASLQNHSFTAVLPRLIEELQLKETSIIFKAPDRYTSGISILSSDEMVSGLARKAFLPVHEPFSTYLAVCIGIPKNREQSVRLGLTRKIKDSSKRPFFLEHFSKRVVLRGEAYPFVMHHQVLSANEKMDVSLVELRNNRNKWHGVRAYCALRLLSPILGDDIFGSCVQTISNKKILVDTFSPVASQRTKIPKPIMNTLELEPSQRSIIPVHMHYAQLDFSKYRSGGYIFTAKPPDTFLWTCEKLGLQVPEHYLQNSYESLGKPKDRKPKELLEITDSITSSNEKIKWKITDSITSSSEKIKWKGS